MTERAGVKLAAERLTWRRARITAVRPESASARSLELAVEGWPGHLAGQHVDLRLTADDGYQAVRSYSIASAPGAQALGVTVERVEGGEVSPYLVDEARVGDQLEVRGPIGGYFVWRPEDGGPLLLVAGGSGIVPLMCMLRTRAAAHSTVPVTLLDSVRSPPALIYGAELDALGQESGVRRITTYTREAPADWSGPRGRVDTALLSSLIGPQGGQTRAYVCGPTPFVETVANALVGLGFGAAQVRTERFGPSAGGSG